MKSFNVSTVVVRAASIAALAGVVAGCAAHHANVPAISPASQPAAVRSPAANDQWGGYPPPPSIAKQIEQLKAKGHNTTSSTPNAPTAIGSR